MYLENSFCCLLILQGIYIPAATYFGTINVQLSFPIWITFALRAAFARKNAKYAQYTRNLSKFSFYWFMGQSTVNFSAQLYCYIFRLITIYDDTTKMTIVEIILVPVAIVSWLWDDFCLLKALHEYSKQPYELAKDFDNIQDNSIKNIELQDPVAANAIDQ